MSYWKGRGTVNAPTSGRYEGAANWSDGSVPGPDADVVFNAGQYLVTHDKPTATVRSVWLQTGVKLRVGAAFGVATTATIDGTVQLGSSFTSEFLAGQGRVIGAGTITSIIGAPRAIVGITPTSLSLQAERGTITIDLAGPFQSQIGGALAGSGTIDFHSGAVALDGGTSLSVANLSISGASVQLGTTLSYGGVFTLDGGALTLGKPATSQTGNLILTGSATLSGGTVTGLGGRSTLYLRGATTITGPATSVESGRLVNTGHVTAIGDLVLGASTNNAATLVNQAGGVYAFDRDVSIYPDFSPHPDGTFKARLINNGSILKNGGSGISDIEVPVTNNGGIQVSSGSLYLNSGVTGTGGFAIDNDSTLSVFGEVSSGQRVYFGSVGDGTLKLSSGFHGTVVNFLAGDTLDVYDIVPIGETLSYKANESDTGGVLTVSEGEKSASIKLEGHYVASGFQLASDGSDGTFVTYSPYQPHETASLAVAHA